MTYFVHLWHVITTDPGTDLIVAGLAVLCVAGILCIPREWNHTDDVDEPAAAGGMRALEAGPVEHLDADDWHPLVEMDAVGPGVLNRAALEEKTQAWLAVVPTDEEVDDARWSTYFRKLDNKLERRRQKANKILVAFDPRCAAFIRALVDRDAEQHKQIVVDAAETVGVDVDELAELVPA